MNPEDIRNIKYSPMLVSEILYHFCMGSKRVEERGVKLELIYLVLPFIMEEEFRAKLKSSNVNSTFKTAFLDKKLNLKEKLFYINDRVKYSKKVTNDGLIYLNSICHISVDDYFNIHCEIEDISSSNDIKSEYLKAAYNLGSIFAKEGYVNVFLKAKVKNI
ncbi:three component ABC system middle component [Photobacterium sanguinicancri]|uniref:three component ABC system middle component n=1 Tax=Photobacterium sanguinicancri TaxID=875932 RepID=UPI0021C3A45D|nr:three component ABC system middle component [Photobacterium sanguinicancri]